MRRKTPALRLAVAALMTLASPVPRADALMAGQTPDTPAARVDPNVPQSIYAGVGSVVVGGSALSGVVIASQYVLTAAHVVSGQQLAAIHFVLNLNGSTQWTSSVESVTIHPTYSFPYDDLAVLKLTNPVPGTVPIYSMYSGSISTGLTIVLAGYGGSGNGDVGVIVGASSSVKRTGTNVVDALQQSVDSGGRASRFYIYDFDSPTGNGTGNSSETLVAVGDSGSPAFIGNGNSLQLFGINNFVNSPTGGTVNYEFGTIGGGIVAADPRFASWLQAATAGTLGQVPVTSDGPLPLWSGMLLAFLLAGILMKNAPAAVASRAHSGAHQARHRD